jgi:hypothetical protein
MKETVLKPMMSLGIPTGTVGTKKTSSGEEN